MLTATQLNFCCFPRLLEKAYNHTCYSFSGYRNLKNQLTFCVVSIQGLSAEALKSIISLCKITGVSGCASNKLRVEKILKHFLYDEETIDKILSKFPKKQQKDDESEEDEEEISTDVRCEAGMLAEILGKLEQNEAKENLEKRERDPKEPPVKKQRPSEECSRTPGEVSQPSVPFEQLVGCPNLSKEKIPPFCSLKVHQGNGSPYVIGTLPSGTKFKGFNSHSRSFEVSGSAASSSSKRAKLTESAARAQVVSWLWDWFNQEGSKSLGKK